MSWYLIGFRRRRGWRTWSGRSTASACAIMLPIDQPGTSGRPRRSARLSALVWLAIASMVSGRAAVRLDRHGALTATLVGFAAAAGSAAS